MAFGESVNTTLCATQSRVIIRVDVDGKNWHSFSNGVKIRHERFWNNLDRKFTVQTLAEVVEGAEMPKGAQVLIHHNSIHDVARIFNHKPLSGEEEASSIKYFSIPETQCYLWRMASTDKWEPLRGFAIALRVFQPIKTQFYGIAPHLIKNTLLITSGGLNGKVVRTLKASDYPIIFLNAKGVEETIIRCRHFPNEHNEREEIIAVDNNLTDQINNGELYVGISVTDAKPLNQYYDSPRPSQIIA